MVNKIIKDVYICPICQTSYDDTFNAEECMQVCIQERYTTEVLFKQKTKFQCQFCLKDFKVKYKAEICEEEHINKKDKHYYLGLDIISKEILKKASEHPSQRKLFKHKKNKRWK